MFLRHVLLFIFLWRTAHAILVNNIGNSLYTVNATFNGKEIVLLLDSGSSDVWITEDIPGANATSKTGSISYAVGDVSGHIAIADMEFAGHKISKQAYIRADNGTSFISSYNDLPLNGLIGIGPSSASVVEKTFNSPAFSPPIDRIFASNTSSDNYVTFLLDRIGDPNDTVAGELTISSLESPNENIVNQFKLPVKSVPKGDSGTLQHWTTYTDAPPAFAADGQPINVTSRVPKAPSGKLAVLIDTGFTYPQASRKVVDAIYGRYADANYDTVSGQWTLPCDIPVNITFFIGGQKIPVHPLDMTTDMNQKDENGRSLCAGTFQPDNASDDSYDIILGMAFLRNAYVLLDYGNFISSPNKTTTKDDPYIQMLALTDSNVALADFAQVRAGGQALQQPTLLPPSEAKTSPETDAEQRNTLIAQQEQKSESKSWIQRYWYIVVAAGASALFGLLAVAAFFIIRRRRARHAYRGLNRPTPAMYETGTDGVNRSLSSNAQRLGPYQSVNAAEEYHDDHDHAPLFNPHDRDHLANPYDDSESLHTHSRNGSVQSLLREQPHSVDYFAPNLALPQRPAGGYLDPYRSRSPSPQPPSRPHS